jgi:hypothetical protein
MTKKPLSRKPGLGKQADLEKFIDDAEKRTTSSEVEEFPWDASNVRDDVTKLFNVRLPEPDYLKLKWLSEQGRDSMHAIALKAIQEEIERRLEK